MTRSSNIYWIIALILANCTLKSHNGKKDENSNETTYTQFNGVSIRTSTLEALSDDLSMSFDTFRRIDCVHTKVAEGWRNLCDTMTHGLVFKGVTKVMALDVVQKYRDLIQADSNFIFLTSFELDSSWKGVFDIAIFKASNAFEAVYLRGTSAPNYDITNQEIVEKLKQWDKMVGLDITVIDDDMIEAQIFNLPTDLASFTQEVYEFCPDVLDQGYGSMREMVSDYQKRKRLELWWD